MTGTVGLADGVFGRVTDEVDPVGMPAELETIGPALTRYAESAAFGVGPPGTALSFR